MRFGDDGEEPLSSNLNRLVPNPRLQKYNSKKKGLLYEVEESKIPQSNQPIEPIIKHRFLPTSLFFVIWNFLSVAFRKQLPFMFSKG